MPSGRCRSEERSDHLVQRLREALLVLGEDLVLLHQTGLLACQRLHLVMSALQPVPALSTAAAGKYIYSLLHSSIACQQSNAQQSYLAREDALILFERAPPPLQITVLVLQNRSLPFQNGRLALQSLLLALERALLRQSLVEAGLRLGDQQVEFLEKCDRCDPSRVTEGGCGP